MGVFNGKKAVDNITILALMAIIALILLFYFTGNLHTLFMDLERLNPKLNHNKVARVNRCLAKYNKEFENFGLSRKCLWNHPCPKIFKHYLCNFWVCSSWKSYLPCNHKNDYASLDGIQYCLEMGARYIELDVFNKNMCPYTEPVVLNGSTPGRYQYSSGLDFEDCCNTIYEYGMLSTPFRNRYGAEPLFVCLNLHLEGNWNTLTKVAKTIKKVFGMKLLPKKPPFRKENLGDFVNLGGLPIYYFIDKIVIICNVNVEYHDQLKLSRMNEIMDMCYKDLAIGQPYKYPLDMDEKKPIPRKSEWLLNFTYEQIENEGSINLNEKRLIRIYPTPVKSINREFDVMKPKNVANDWAINMFSANKGAPQFCLMDFSSVDNNFKEYMAFFFGVDDNEEVVSEESDRNQRRIILDKKKEAMDELAKIKKQKSEMSKLDRTKCNMNQRTHDLENMIKEYNEALGLGGMSCGIKGVTKGYAFALKPKDLQCPIMETRAPVKQDRALSAATKKSSTQFGDFAF
tara:strand:- start:4947 stop:6488 length:1542 start_codon:yes stop_codon:yes gene_type:complete